jgi:fructose-1,6-bisphosphatase/inositol monophosphatase family enzyme
VASGILLVQEAGGEVIDWNSNMANYRSSGIIASNKALNKEFIDFAKSNFPDYCKS